MAEGGARPKVPEQEAQRIIEMEVHPRNKEEKSSGSADPIQHAVDMLKPRFDQLHLLSQRLEALERDTYSTPPPGNIHRRPHDISLDSGVPPTVNPQTPRRSVISFDNGPGPIRIKDALETIPIFDGYKPSVFQFLRACERARNMLAEEQEPYLVRLIANKLRGHALLAIEDNQQNIESMEELADRLRDMFAPYKTVNQYRGDLGNNYKRPGEHILDYIGRVREIRLAIIDATKKALGRVSRDKQREIDQDTLESFCNGLPSEILIRLKIERYRDLEDAYLKAVRIAQQIKQEKERYRSTSSHTPTAGSGGTQGNQNLREGYRRATDVPHYRPYPQPISMDPPRQQQQQAQQQRQQRPEPRNQGVYQQQQRDPRQDDVNVCRYCKNPGHVIDECRKYRYKVETGQIIPYARRQTNNPGNETGIPEPSTDAGANRNAGNSNSDNNNAGRRTMTATVATPPASTSQTST